MSRRRSKAIVIKQLLNFLYFQRFAFWIYLTITLSLIIAYKLNYLSKVWGYFKTTKLYNHLTRYEITDGHSKFEKMLRSKERFINEITHELRTPIQLINGSLEGISKTAHAASKELICVQDNMKRVEQLINQMSQDVPKALAAADYYRSYSPDNIKFIVLSLEPLAKHKRQNLELRIKGKKEISLINDSLEKILANLIQNAIKFTPELGTIKVAAIQDSKVLKVNMDLRLKTEKRFIKHFFVFGAILMFFCLIISNDARALGVTLNGKTKFAGIPAGIIRDIEVVGDAVYIASENGVFKYLGGQSERVIYGSTLSTRGTVSDL